MIRFLREILLRISFFIILLFFPYHCIVSPFFENLIVETSYLAHHHQVFSIRNLSIFLCEEAI